VDLAHAAFTELGAVGVTRAALEEGIELDVGILDPAGAPRLGGDRLVLARSVLWKGCVVRVHSRHRQENTPLSARANLHTPE
jgi:hypothetical protein